MDLHELIQGLTDIVNDGRDQLYTVEDKRTTLENLEHEIQEAVNSIEDAVNGLDEVSETVRQLEDDLIPDAIRLTADY